MSRWLSYPLDDLGVIYLLGGTHTQERASQLLFRSGIEIAVIDGIGAHADSLNRVAEQTGLDSDGFEVVDRIAVR